MAELRLKTFILVIFVLNACFIQNILCDLEPRTSLVFVIDITKSMKTQIRCVHNESLTILNTAINSNKSPVENFVLAYFADPNPKFYNVTTVTTNKTEFSNALNLTRDDLKSGGDCPELSMAGIEIAINASMYGALIYVFTDAGAKDHDKYEKVKRLAVKKGCQITFILFDGNCAHVRDKPEEFHVYHKLAETTSGQVFNLAPSSTKWILKYVKDSIVARRIILYSKTHPPGLHTIEFEVDSKLEDVRIAHTKPMGTGSALSPYVKGPDGRIIEKEDLDQLLNLTNILVLKIEQPEPGKYTVSFLNNGTSHLEISGKTDVTFRHGFSTNIVPSLNDTFANPVIGEKNYLYIQLFGENVELNTVIFLNKDFSEKMKFPLRIQNATQNLYVTEPFNPPHDAFRIQVKGIDTETKTGISRLGHTVLGEERFNNTKPTVTIKGESKRTVDRNTTISLECEVKAYPAPIIIWTDMKTGEKLTADEYSYPPYNYSKIFSEKVSKNTTYMCCAENNFGFDNKTVEVYVNPEPYIDLPAELKDLQVNYNATAVLSCNVKSFPPSKVSWHFPKKLSKFVRVTETTGNNSTLNIIKMKTWTEGTYSCKIKYNNETYWRRTKVTLKEKKPSIEKEPLLEEVSVSEDETELKCRLLQGIPAPEMQWYFKPDEDITAEYREKEEGRNLTTLSLKKLNIHDSGYYFCKATNILGSDERYFKLSVERAPKIKDDINTNKTAAMGTVVDFECVVSGVPTPNVTWYKDDHPLEVDGFRVNVYTGYKLRLQNITIGDTGIYKCKAENKGGSAEKTTNLTVHYLQIEPPDDSKITKSVNRKKNLKLNCDAEGFPGPIKYKWIFNSFDKTIINKTIQDFHEDGQYALKMIESNRGFYTCIASNGITALSISYEVDILFPAKILDRETYIKHKVVEGDILTISCNATGNPRPTIEWWSNGHPLNTDNFNVALGDSVLSDESKNILTFSNISRQDGREYRCSAKNQLKTVDGPMIEVIVESSPPLDQVKHNKNMLLEIGSKAKVDCPLPRSNLDRLVWYKDGKVHHLGELEFENVAKSKAGVYTCRINKINYPYEKQTASTTVIVGSKPKFISSERNVREVNFNEDVSLNCKADGDPTPTVTWTHNGKLKESEMVHNFSMASFDPVGKYDCKVYNEFGSIVRKFDVDYKDCVLKINSSTQNHSLMLTSASAWPSFPTIDGYTIIPKNQKVTFICPKTFTKFKNTEIQATCYGKRKLEIFRTLYEYSDIECVEEIKPRLLNKPRSPFKSMRSPRSNLRVTRSPNVLSCLGDQTKAKQLVFDIGHKTLNILDYCLDKHKNTLYTKHVMRSPANFVPAKTTMWDGTNLDNYKCETQRNRFRKMDYRINDCCFDKRYLVNAKDLSPGPMQRSVYNRLNIVPHWSTCHTENWDDVEERLRELSKSTNNDLIIFTGIAGYWTKNVQRKIEIMSINRKQYIPKYLWKVIQNPASRSSIAIIQVNIPYISRREAERYHTLCRDICQEVAWMRGWQWKDASRGYTYCCNLNDFTLAFEKQRFDRDFVTWNVFEPYFNVLI